MPNDLTILDVARQKIKTSIENGQTNCSLRSLNLADWPPELFEHTNLERLDLSDNQLTAIPSEIRRLTNLQVLKLAKNAVVEVPSDIGKLRHLKYLGLQHNQLLAIPSELGNLIDLTLLHLDHNNLSRLPSEIGKLINLTSLSLENNQLTSLPAEIGQLINLETLSLQNNQLTSLPVEIGRLDKLQSLSLRDDQLLPLLLATRIREFDVFISHASEDKETVALPLTQALITAGLKVWIDNQEIKLGDSIREKIDEGLSKSRFGVVVLSPSFVKKGWTQRELNGLLAIEDAGEKMILPVWHKISKEELTRFSPILADRAAAFIRDGIAAVASQIVDVVLYQANNSPSSVFPSLTRRFVQLMRDSSVLAIRDFLIQHHGIMDEAAAGPSWHVTSCKPRLLGGEVPGLEAYLVNDATRPDRRSETFAFASPTTPLLDAEDIVSAETGSLSKWATWYSGTIVAGRRNLLSESDKMRLNNFNEANEHVTVRTYDWLIESCVSAEKRSMAFRTFSDEYTYRIQ